MTDTRELKPLQGPEFDMDALRRAVDKVAGCLYQPERAVVSASDERQAIMAMLENDDSRIRENEG